MSGNNQPDDKSDMSETATATARPPSSGTTVLSPPIVTPEDVRRCLDTTGPVMRFQPIVHSDSGRVIGAEAFSRFPSSAPVLDWFRCAERAGYGPELELRAVTNIVETRSQWPDTWEMVCVNVSPDRLCDEPMREALTSSPGRRLVVELTDQTALPTDYLLRRHLDKLRDNGVLIAVSGLRDGDAQFQRILRIEPEVVKLDMSVLVGIADDTRRRPVEQLVTACSRHGIVVVAVGVETDEQLEFVRRVGIDAAQGHLFGAPTDLGSPCLSHVSVGTPILELSR